jgi:hypothetical protein
MLPLTYKISLNKASLPKILGLLIFFLRYSDGNKEHLKGQNGKSERQSIKELREV